MSHLRIYCIGNSKGGVGKSTIAVNLAVCASLDGQKTIIIDTDTPQSSSASWRALRSDRDKDDIACIQVSTPTLHKDLKTLTKGFDTAIIDCGGRATPVFRSAMIAAGLNNGLLIIPVLPSTFDVFAAQDTINILNEALPVVEIKARFLLNRLAPKTVIGAEVIEAMASFSGVVPLLESRLYNHVGRDGYSTSLEDGKGVLESAPRSAAAAEITALYKELKALI